MTSFQLSHYRVLHQLGAGGMGEVYLAEDLQLGRKVALKLLPASSSGDEGARKRLIREAQAAAALDHPNICAIYEVSSDQGRDFIAMQYVEGRTLAARIGEKTLELREALGIAAQIAEALGEAHRRGIVHRDIKPSNILITPQGQVKVMDFGLAKLVRSADENAETERQLTRPGGTVGTAAYMSPEQVRSESVDGRSDLFALGSVLYEMITGVRAFEASSSAEAVSAILTRDPPPMARYAHDLPDELERIVRKALQKKKEERYQSARDLALDLKRLGETRSHPHRKRKSIAAAGVGLIILAVLVVALLQLQRGRDRPAGNVPAVSSIAVLPLQNLSADPAQEYFVDGMTEALITELAGIKALRVISRTSTMQYKSARKPLPEIARELNVDAIVEGSVLKAGDRVRITAQLIHAGTDRHLWADNYDRDLQDVFTIHSEVAKAIARQIDLTLTPQDQRRLAASKRVNPQANEAYLQGLYYFNKAINEPSDQASIEAHHKSFEQFEHAIQIDPNYAEAWAGLARSYHWLASLGFPEFYPKAKTTALRAIELDETNAEAHGALAFTIQNLDWDWEGAEREYRRALELNPNSGNVAHHGYALLLSQLGRHEEAIAEIHRAQELDPLTIPLKTNIGFIYRMARDYDRALAQFRRVLEIWDLPIVHVGIGMAYVDKKMYSEGIAELRKAVELNRGSPYTELRLGWAYALQGDRASAMRILEKVEKASGKTPGLETGLAALLTALGDSERALQWLERGYEKRTPGLAVINVLPEFDPLRSDPRFQSLLERMGLKRQF